VSRLESQDEPPEAREPRIFVSGKDDRRKHAPVWVFALVLVVAVILRFGDLGSAGISHWDAGTYTAGPLGVGPYADSSRILFQTPPLVPSLFGLVFDVWEPIDTLAMGVVALLGVATVAAVFLAGRRWVGDAAAMAGAAALAGMPYHLLYSRQALTDAPFTLFLLLAIWASASAVNRRSHLLAILAGVASGAAMLTKDHGFLALAIVAVWLLLRERIGSRALRREATGKRASGADAPSNGWRIWFVAAAVAAVPAIWLVLEIDRTIGLAEFRESRREWLSAPGLYLLPMTARLVARSLWEWVSPWVLVPALLGFGVMLRRRTQGDLLVCFFAAAFLLAMPAYRYYPRLLVPFLVPLAMAAGVGLDTIATRLLPRWRNGRTAALSLLLLVPGMWGARTTLAVEDRGYEIAARFLSQGPKNVDPDVLVTQHAILFYLRGSSHPFLCYDQPGALEALQSGRFRFLVTDLRLEHAPEFRGYLEAHREDLKAVAEIGNPLPATTIVNSAGFKGLDLVRSGLATPEERAMLETIRVWRPLRRDAR
jgi:4-amino-4-deoxy-L-arabinose transferase-like glycosyltransferase